MKALSAAASIAFFILTSMGQTPVPPGPPTGRIEGTVFRSGSNEPLRGARVTLTRINASTGSPINLVGGGTSTSTTSPGSPTPVPGLNITGRSGAAPAPSTVPALPPDPLPIPPVLTDTQGHFALTELEPGSYRISIASNGYVRQEYGQRIFPGQGTLLNLAAGQPAVKLTSWNTWGMIRGMFMPLSIPITIMGLKEHRKVRA